jgi:hypothetical protein
MNTLRHGGRRSGWQAFTAVIVTTWALSCTDDGAAIELPSPSDDVQSNCFERAGPWAETDFRIELALTDGAATHRGWLLGRSPDNLNVQVLRLDDRGIVESLWTWPSSGAFSLRGIVPGVREGTALVDVDVQGGPRFLSLLDANAGADPLAAGSVPFESLYTDGGPLAAYTVSYAASADRTLLMLGPTAAPDLGLVFLLLELDDELEIIESWNVFYDPGVVALPFAMADMIEGRPLALPALPLTVFPYARILVDVDPASVSPASIVTLWVGRIRGDRGTVEIVDPVVIEAGYTDGPSSTQPDVIDAAADATTTWYLYDDVEATGDALLVAIDDVRDVAVLAQLDDVGVTAIRLLQLPDGVALVRHLVGEDTVEVTRLEREFDPTSGQITLSGVASTFDAARVDPSAIVDVRTAGVGHLMVDYADGRSLLQGVRCVPANTRSRLPQVRSTIVKSTRSPGAEPS